MNNNMLDYGCNQGLRRTVMIKVPYFLYTIDIINTIKGFIKTYHAEDFDSLKSTEKDILINYALTSCEYDIDIVLSRDTNKCFSDYINRFRSIGLYKLEQAIQQDYYDHFSYAFNQIFKEVIDQLKQDRSDDMRHAS